MFSADSLNKRCASTSTDQAYITPKHKFSASSLSATGLASYAVDAVVLKALYLCSF